MELTVHTLPYSETELRENQGWKLKEAERVRPVVYQEFFILMTVRNKEN